MFKSFFGIRYHGSYAYRFIWCHCNAGSNFGTNVLHYPTAIYPSFSDHYGWQEQIIAGNSYWELREAVRSENVRPSKYIFWILSRDWIVCVRAPTWPSDWFKINVRQLLFVYLFPVITTDTSNSMACFDVAESDGLDEVMQMVEKNPEDIGTCIKLSLVKFYFDCQSSNFLH